jgi:hypothetical protein
MHVPIKVKSPNNISEWQMGLNSAFKGLNLNADYGIRYCAVYRLVIIIEFYTFIGWIVDS